MKLKKCKSSFSRCGCRRNFCGYGRIFNSASEYDIHRFKRYLKFNEKKKNTFINNYKLKYQNKKFRSDFEHLIIFIIIFDDEKNYI